MVGHGFSPEANQRFQRTIAIYQARMGHEVMMRKFDEFMTMLEEVSRKLALSLSNPSTSEQHLREQAKLKERQRLMLLVLELGNRM